MYGCNKPYETPSLKLVSTGIEGYSRRRLLSFIEKSPLKIYRKHYEYEFYSKTLDMKVILKFSKKKKTQQNKKPTTKFGGFDTHWPVTASYCSLPFISLGRFNRYLGKVGSNGFLRFWIYA